tara:strand:- start:404 stop:745 length:342 start_codon:yes stop_codon:yes gene_type:complete
MKRLRAQLIATSLLLLTGSTAFASAIKCDSYKNASIEQLQRVMEHSSKSDCTSACAALTAHSACVSAMNQHLNCLKQADSDDQSISFLSLTVDNMTNGLNRRKDGVTAQCSCS